MPSPFTSFSTLSSLIVHTNKLNISFSFMALWFPQDAMRAYLSTLQLLKIHNHEDKTMGSTRQVIEPESVEFLSALAAGNRAKLMIQIASNGPTQLTIALAVAAKEIGGQLICIVPRHKVGINSSYFCWIMNSELKQVIKFVTGDPCEVIKKYKKIEFGVLDCKVENVEEIMRDVDLNTSGSIVVLSNVMSRGSLLSFGEIFKGRKGVEYVNTKPIGEGMELMRIGCFNKCERRYNRFHVTFEHRDFK